MATVLLRLEWWLGGVVATVRAVADPERPGSTAPTFSKRIVIASGTGRYGTPLLLEPGLYSVSVQLPSRELATKLVRVTGGPEIQEVHLDIRSSPHEWLSWQQFFGNVTRSESAFRDFAANLAELGTPEAVTVTELVGPDGSWMARLLNEHLREGAGRDFEEALRHAIRSATAQTPFTLGAPQHGTNVDGPFLSLLFTQAPQVRGNRHYLLARAGTASLLSVLPVPWKLSVDDVAATVEVLMGPEPASAAWTHEDVAAERTLMVATVVRDHRLGSALGYLKSGDLPAAAEVLGSAEMLLFEKMENPLAAAAGAYVLIDECLRKTRYRLPQWMAWVSNLWRLFPWLPDGAILYGWLALRGQDAPDVAAARRAFLEARLRGISFYSSGVRLLVDGLSLVANDARADGKPDGEVEEALHAVRRLSLHVDTRQPFTVLRLT